MVKFRKQEKGNLQFTKGTSKMFIIWNLLTMIIAMDVFVVHVSDSSSVLLFFPFQSLKKVDGCSCSHLYRQTSFFLKTFCVVFSI
jgi:hypothetical protein